MDKFDKRMIEWLMSNDTGVSSTTMFCVLSGQELKNNYDIPYDPSDFGRCYRLLQLFPEWRCNLHKISKAIPMWKPIIDNWEELESLYLEELPKRTLPKLYAKLKELRHDCLIADGYIQISIGSYQKGW